MTAKSIDADTLHRDAIIIDATCPLARHHDKVDWWRQGGATAILPTVTGRIGNALSGFGEIGGWHRYVRERDDAVIVRRAADIEQAKRDGKMGLVLHCQGTAIFEDRLDLVDAYAEAGLRVVQLCYNVANSFGDGASVDDDRGLSPFGHDLVARLNAIRLLVDCSHTGERTSRDAVAASTAPVIISHANARGLRDNRRNVSDDLIRAVADNGGVVGTVGYPAFLVAEGQASLDQFIDDIAYKADLVGIDHTGLGIDYYEGQHHVADLESAKEKYAERLAEGTWDPRDYPPPPYVFPEGIETPKTLPNLTRRLVERGFSETDIRKVLGGNWLRVFAAVWGG